MAFMRAVNPCVDWTETQWRLIVDEVCLQPTPYVLQCISPVSKRYKGKCVTGSLVMVYIVYSAAGFGCGT